MIKDAYRRYRLLEGALEGDAEYLWLAEQARELAPRAEEILCALPEDQQRVLTEYMGICQEKSGRMVDWLAFCRKKEERILRLRCAPLRMTSAGGCSAVGAPRAFPLVARAHPTSAT